MMALRLERFDRPAEPGPDGTEQARLAGYEAGYAAGWEDAAARTADAATASRLELTQTLQDLGFGFHEARAHLLAALRPLFASMTATVLPLIGRETLARHVAKAMMPLAEVAAGAPVVIRCHPADSLLLGEAAADADIPIRFITDETRLPGQLILSALEQETEIDLHRAVEEVETALLTFFQTTAPTHQAKVTHG